MCRYNWPRTTYAIPSIIWMAYYNPTTSRGERWWEAPTCERRNTVSDDDLGCKTFSVMKDLPAPSYCGLVKPMSLSQKPSYHGALLGINCHLMPLGFKAPSSLGEVSSCCKSFAAGEPSALRCYRVAFTMNGELTDPNRTTFNNIWWTYFLGHLVLIAIGNTCSVDPLQQVGDARMSSRHLWLFLSCARGIGPIVCTNHWYRVGPTKRQSLRLG